MRWKLISIGIIDNFSSTIEFFVFQNNRVEVLIYAADIQSGTRGVIIMEAHATNAARARYTRKVKIDCFAQNSYASCVIISVRTLRFMRLL